MEVVRDVDALISSAKVSIPRLEARLMLKLVKLLEVESLEMGIVMDMDVDMDMVGRSEAAGVGVRDSE